MSRLFCSRTGKAAVLHDAEPKVWGFTIGVGIIGQNMIYSVSLFELSLPLKFGVDPSSLNFWLCHLESALRPRSTWSLGQNSLLKDFGVYVYNICIYI